MSETLTPPVAKLPGAEARKGLDQEVIDRMIDHIRNNTTDMSEHDMRVPVANYASPAYAAAERALFKRLPIVAAHASQIAQPGQFYTRELMGVPILLVRKDDGTAACYLNRCRHRGGKVEPETAGSKRVFTCAYHGWSYGRDGALRGVPYEEFYEPIDRACNSLYEVKVEERHGLLWVDFSNDQSRTVADFLGAADQPLSTFEIDEMVVYADRAFDLDINWKLVCDGAIDITHPPFLHVGGVDELLHSNAGVWRDYGRHGQLFTCRKRLAEKIRAGEPIQTAWRYFATNLFIYPNIMCIAAPDHIEFWTVWPHKSDPAKCTAQIRFLTKPENLNEEMTGRMDRSWEILRQAALEEDFPMEASIQANAVAQPSGTFLYGRNEVCTQHLHKGLRADIGDAAEPPAGPRRRLTAHSHGPQLGAGSPSSPD